MGSIYELKQINMEIIDIIIMTILTCMKFIGEDENQSKMG